MTVYLNLEVGQGFDRHRDHFWRAGYVDQTNFDFRDTRELLERFHFSRHFDEVIYLSADTDDIDKTTKTKLNFYLDKTAKSAAAKARNQNIAIVTNGTIGLSSHLSELAKSYTGTKGVQISTIGVSCYGAIDAGLHTPGVVADGKHIFQAAKGLDLHILVKFKDKLSPDLAYGAELETLYSIISGMITNLGSLTAIYAKSSSICLLELMIVKKAVEDGVPVNPVLVEGAGGTTDAMIAYFHDIEPDTEKVLVGEDRLQDLHPLREMFIHHSVTGTMPDSLPTGITLDKTGRPYWETLSDINNYL